MGLQKKLDKLYDKLSALEQRIRQLEQSNKNIREKNTDLKHKNEKLLRKNEDLEKEIEQLKSIKNVLKDSKNSSIPPSKDENRVKGNKSLRKASGLKTGGQKGHKGSTLKMSATPDEIKHHLPNQCSCCGEFLDGQVIFQGKRQVIDIPVIKPSIIEHQIYSVKCKCGNTTKSKYPKDVNSPVSYGANIEVLINYLNTRQYISLVRIEEFLRQVMDVKMSQATICLLYTSPSPRD